jgi:hypothetical protein
MHLRRHDDTVLYALSRYPATSKELLFGLGSIFEELGATSLILVVMVFVEVEALSTTAFLASSLAPASVAIQWRPHIASAVTIIHGGVFEDLGFIPSIFGFDGVGVVGATDSGPWGEVELVLRLTRTILYGLSM